MHECFRGGLKTPHIVQEAINEATILSLVHADWVLALSSEKRTRWRCPRGVVLLPITDLDVPLHFAPGLETDNCRHCSRGLLPIFGLLRQENHRQSLHIRIFALAPKVSEALGSAPPLLKLRFPLTDSPGENVAEARASNETPPGCRSRVRWRGSHRSWSFEPLIFAPPLDNASMYATMNTVTNSQETDGNGRRGQRWPRKIANEEVPCMPIRLRSTFIPSHDRREPSTWHSHADRRSPQCEVGGLKPNQGESR